MNLITLGVSVMKSITPILLTVMILLAVLSSSAFIKANSMYIESLNVNVKITKDGIMYYNMTFTFPNGGTYLSLILPREYSDALIHYTSKNLQVNITAIDNKTLVILKSDKSLNEMQINLTLILGPWIKPGELSLNIPIVPLMPFRVHLLSFKMRLTGKVSTSDVKIHSPKDAVVKREENTTYVLYLSENIPENKEIYLRGEVSVVLENTLFIRALERKVEVNPGKIVIYDSYVIENFGENTIRTITIPLPNATRNIQVYGGVGAYFKNLHRQGGFWITHEEGRKEVNVGLLHPINRNEQCKVIVKYEIDVKNRTYRIPLGYLMNAPIKKYKVVVIIPGDITSYELDPQPLYIIPIKNAYKAVYEIDKPNVSNDGYISLSVKYNPLIEHISPIYLLALLSIVIMAIWYVTPLIRKEVLPEERVLRIVNILEEMIATVNTLRELEDQFSRGKISEKIYVSQSEELRKRMNSLRDKLESIVEEERGITLEEEIADRIINSASNVISSCTTLCDIELRYRRREITRRQYIRSRALYRSSLERNLSRMNSVIRTLRERITKA